MRLGTGQAQWQFIGAAAELAEDIGELSEVPGQDIVLAYWPDRAAAADRAESLGPESALILMDVPVHAELRQLAGRSLALLPVAPNLDQRLRQIQVALQGLAAGIRLPEAGPAPATKKPGSLSRREIQILNLLADGKANKEIAAVLGISEGTVKFHLGDIFSKLGASNRAQAVRRGIENGLLAL